MLSVLKSVIRYVRIRVRRSIRLFGVTVQYNQFRRSLVPDRLMRLDWRDRYLCLDDATSQTGFDRHYVYHTSWAARQIQISNPEMHIDISSSLFFAGIASAFVKIHHYDFRPPPIELDNLLVGRCELTNLSFATGTVLSLSCMHVVEHIGLGRYGDPIDANGDIKACAELARVLAKNGRLLFVVPVGAARICFNAHRVYSFQSVLNLFPDLKLLDWDVIPDIATIGLVEQPSAEFINSQRYACGCFVFTK